jgi:hypothetical protein
MKKFFMTAPYQPEGQLRCSVYKAVGNPSLDYDEPVSFPLLAAINSYASDGEEIEVVVLVSEYINAENNFTIFCSQLEKLCSKKKLHLKNGSPTRLSVPYNELLDTQLEVFRKLTDMTEDGDTLYACMTYGTKAIPVVQMMALNYAYKVRKNISIGCIVYGAVDFNTKETCIYDITSLFYMNQIVDTVAMSGASDPAGAIKLLLSQEADE